jgi:hypothetical protein
VRVDRYSGWRQLCVRAQPCMQGSGDTAYLLCMLCCLNIQWVRIVAGRPTTALCEQHNACMWHALDCCDVCCHTATSLTSHRHASTQLVANTPAVAVTQAWARPVVACAASNTSQPHLHSCSHAMLVQIACTSAVRMLVAPRGVRKILHFCFTG